jgi:hypothetical protein
MCSLETVSAISIIGLLKCVHLLVDLIVCAQNDVEEQCPDADPEERIKYIILQVSSSGETSEALEWCQELLSGQADVHIPVCGKAKCVEQNCWSH